jgi:NAD(P)-dependent dehydrogenase (short-subunit alcohol dehydrogenase family)
VLLEGKNAVIYGGGGSIGGAVARAFAREGSFNVISHSSAHGRPLAEMALEDFTREVMAAVTTTFLTARAAARHMIRQRSG